MPPVKCLHATKGIIPRLVGQTVELTILPSMERSTGSAQNSGWRAFASSTSTVTAVRPSVYAVKLKRKKDWLPQE